MSAVPDSTLPLWARTTGRFLRCLLYGFTAVVGVGDVWFTSSVITDSQSVDQSVIGGAVCMVAGLIGMAAVVTRRWRWEWVAASVAAFTLLGRAVPVWFALESNMLRLSAAAGMTIAAIGVGLRAMDLWVFASTTGYWARRAQAKRKAAS